MAELYHVDITIRDDMSETEVVETLREIAKGLNRLAGAALARGKCTALTPAMQPLFTAMANVETAANNWGGPSNLAVPQVVGQRPH